MRYVRGYGSDGQVVHWGFAVDDLEATRMYLYFLRRLGCANAGLVECSGARVFQLERGLS